MNNNQKYMLGTIEQQRAALPQLIQRQGTSTATQPVRGLVFGMTPKAESSNFSTMHRLGGDSVTANPGQKTSAVDSMLRMLALMGLLALGGCAGLTQPMSDMELRAEADSCANSTLCRTFIEDRPPVLTLAVNDARLCETNARFAEAVLKREGVNTRRFVVRLKPLRSGDFQTAEAQTQLLHTFVAAKIDKRWYAVDNGALPFCDRVCRLDEALHGVELISGSIKPEVSVGTAVLAAR